MKVEEQKPTWARAKQVSMEEGWACVRVDLHQDYEPGDYPHLPALLAKVTNEEAAERFLWNWGPLGFSRLLHSDQWRLWPEKYHPGLLVEWEPVDWIVAHAQTVNFALNLIDGLKRGDRASVERVLRQRRLRTAPAEVVSIEEPELRGKAAYATYYVASGGEYGGQGGRLEDGTEYGGGWFREAAYPFFEGERAIEHHAEVIVADLVNRNTEGLRHELRVDHVNGGFQLRLRAKGLIEPIWLHLQNAALGGEVCRCQECGAPFIRTHKAQVFCPPDLPGSRSRCAARYHKRVQRSK